jgi:hypothetical protein
LTSEELLLKWLKNAILWAKVQRDAVTKLESAYPKEVIDGWKAMVAAWNRDHTQPDPYKEPEHREF